MWVRLGVTLGDAQGWINAAPLGLSLPGCSFPLKPTPLPGSGARGSAARGAGRFALCFRDLLSLPGRNPSPLDEGQGEEERRGQQEAAF